MTLEAAGHQVRCASTAAEALTLADGAQAAVVDLRIPSLADGVNLIRTLAERWPQMKRIVVTGWRQDLASLGIAADEIFEKPINTKRLLRVLG